MKLGKDVIFSLKGYFLFLTFVLSFVSFSSDLKIADRFEDGDIVSADTFNEIFDTIEKINRTVKCSKRRASKFYFIIIRVKSCVYNFNIIFKSI